MASNLEAMALQLNSDGLQLNLVCFVEEPLVVDRGLD